MNLVDEPPLGAHAEAAGVRFTAWSDRARAISVVIYAEPKRIKAEIPLVPQAESGFFSGFVPGLQPGCLYDFRIDAQLAVDPYARELPHGVHGPGRVMAALRARKHAKRAIDLDRNEVFYELHVGTFTPEGTFASALQRLPYLRELGVTVIELMPVATFAGKRGWGYDGVALFAPFACYGGPEDLNAFVDAAHGLGLSVVLDVVYNHLGPAGNALPTFSDSYFDAARTNAWGQVPGLEGLPFRRLILSNAEYWLNTLGMDGLRLDATHELEPGGQPHILRALSEIARACEPPAVLIAEDNRNDPRSLLAHGIDAVWSDDFHHVLHVLLTHEQEGYYRAFTGSLSELARVIERGQLFEGQAVRGSGKPRGQSAEGVPASRFLFALQNHDQVGNRARGERLHHLSTPTAFRAATLLLSFLPATPLLFMGQEWAASSPFLYFSDHEGELGHAVSRGRRQEFGQFSAFQAPADAIPDPQAEATFAASKLDWSEQTAHEQQLTLRLCRRAFALRRTDPVLRARSQLSAGFAHDCLWVQRSTPNGSRLLLYNPGAARSLPEIVGRSPAEMQPLLASAELPETSDRFELPESSAVLFAILERPEAVIS
ncbi:MAG TPA: malto-oligosyltrehalose trehalohydrolase [Polyangiaceae bacterium]|nr:malto-oligosyltrehalose trehalohydrolase [Polyangiaceae bacterium]